MCFFYTFVSFYCFWPLGQGSFCHAASPLLNLEADGHELKQTTPSKSLMNASHTNEVKSMDGFKLQIFLCQREYWITSTSVAYAMFMFPLIGAYCCLHTFLSFKVPYCLATRKLALSAAQEPTFLKYIFLHISSCYFPYQINSVQFFYFASIQAWYMSNKLQRLSSPKWNLV